MPEKKTKNDMIFEEQKVRAGSKGFSIIYALIFILPIVLLIYVGYKLSVPYIHNYSIKGVVKDAIREIIKYADEEETQRYVKKKLSVWNIYYEPGNIRIYDDEGYRYFEMIYSEPVTFLGRWTLLFEFHPRLKVKKR